MRRTVAVALLAGGLTVAPLVQAVHAQTVAVATTPTTTVAAAEPAAAPAAETDDDDSSNAGLWGLLGLLGLGGLAGLKRRDVHQGTTTGYVTPGYPTTGRPARRRDPETSSMAKATTAARLRLAPSGAARCRPWSQPEADHDEIEVLVGNPHARRVVVYTWKFQPDLVETALRKGVCGYLSKTLTARELVEALEAIHRRDIVVSRAPTKSHKGSGQDWPGRSEA